MQYESSLKNETAKFQAFHENFCKEKATSLQALKGTPWNIVIGGLISSTSDILIRIFFSVTI